jgi:hypothetical protein
MAAKISVKPIRLWILEIPKPRRAIKPVPINANQNGTANPSNRIPAIKHDAPKTGKVTRLEKSLA